MAKKEKLRFNENIVAVLKNKKGEKKVIKAENIITNDGDVFYAQKSCGETPTNNFVNAVLGTGSTAESKTDTYSSLTPISGSNKAPTSGYPRTNDNDSDNSDAGTDVITWKYEWAGGDFSSSSVHEGVVTITSPTSGSPILCRWVWSSAFSKDSDTTLKVFVNHTANGV